MHVPTSQTSRVMDQIRRTVLRQDATALTDGQLLDCFLRNHDEAAFEALVRQHGPMVWGVCRRILVNHHDVEDAFQATFLVLVRRAAAIVPKEMLANWLYGVAHQTALKARSIAAKKRARETPMAHLPEPAAAGNDPWNDLRPVLDLELSRLPDKYRVAIVLCDLEGKTRKAVARQLNIPEGTVSSRLATARAMLAKRLARHGVTLSSASLALLLGDSTASASVPSSIVSSTVQAASLFATGQTGGAIPANVVALSEGVLAMSQSKLRIATAVVLTSALACYFLGLPYFASSAAGQGDSVRDAKAQDRKSAEVSPKNTITVRAQIDKIDVQSRTISVQVPSEAERIYRYTESVGSETEKGLANYYGELAALTMKEPTRLTNLPIAKNATLTSGDEVAKLSDLKEGMRVTLQLTAKSHGLVVSSIRMAGKVDQKKPRIESTVLEVIWSEEPITGKKIPAPKESTDANTDRETLQGIWYVAALEEHGERSRERDFAKAARWVFLGDQIVTFDPRSSGPESDVIFRFELDTGHEIKHIRLVVVNKQRDKITAYPGIYSLKGGSLRICIQMRPEAARPTGFTTRDNPGYFLWEFQRTPPK
jgi:RNA polymerase sigma factor (sigma-70 family)